MSRKIGEKFESILDLLDPVRDILEGRVIEAEPPPWCHARGWEGFLLGLREAELLEAERAGLPFAEGALSRAPASLRALCAELRPWIEASLGEGEGRPGAAPLAAPLATARHLRPHKRTQIEALLALAQERVRGARRLVELGAGHGHLSRWLARELGVAAIGLERDADRVAAARRIAEEERGEGAAPIFVRAEVGGGVDLAIDPPLGPDDLLLGLHACGALGDALVQSARRSGASALLVSCCLQKGQGEAREPLSERARGRGFRFPRVMLGLTNLAYTGDDRSMAKIIQKLERRHALRLLLLGRGLPLGPRDEAHGVHRRDFEGGLSRAADKALGYRGLSPASEAELRETERAAREEHARIRRLSLPRSMLGRLVELAIVLDRAAALEEAGREVWAGPVFRAAHSPRNLGLLATPP